MSFDELNIVVIGRNEGQRLINCLISLESHKGRVVYVDSGSSDASIAAAERLGAFVVKLDPSQPFTAARARNEGFAAILTLRPHAEFVQFIDGDCELNRDWVSVALKFIIGRKDIAVACGRRRERYPKRSIYNRLCDIEWDTPIGAASACGGDSLVRVKAFQEVSGFRSNLIAGEEPEFCARLLQRGWKVWRLDAEMTRHDAAMTRFTQWWLRTLRSGYAQAEISLLNLSPGIATIEKREVARASFWGALIPLGVSIGALFQPFVLLAILIYPIQIVRIAIRRDASSSDSWLYAVFMMIAKFAQLHGILRYFWRRWRKRRIRIIEYE